MTVNVSSKCHVNCIHSIHAVGCGVTTTTNKPIQLSSLCLLYSTEM